MKEAAMTLFLNILRDWFKLAVWNSIGPPITADMVFINISLLKSILLQLKYTNAPAHARIKEISFFNSHAFVNKVKFPFWSFNSFLCAFLNEVRISTARRRK